jgi:hypothetical protein
MVLGAIAEPRRGSLNREGIELTLLLEGFEQPSQLSVTDESHQEARVQTSDERLKDPFVEDAATNREKDEYIGEFRMMHQEEVTLPAALLSVFSKGVGKREKGKLLVLVYHLNATAVCGCLLKPAQASLLATQGHSPYKELLIGQERIEP